MKAVRIVEPYRVEVCELPEPSVGDRDVLIRVKGLGLCGSDLMTYRGGNPMVSYPRIPGHEIAGEVVEIGVDVPGELAAGSLVTISPYTACGKCSACRAGRVNCCRYNETMGVQRDGAAAEYIAVPYGKVFESAGLGLKKTVCVEPLSVGWHAVERGGVGEDDLVVVFGCGMIGLGAVAAAAYKKAKVVAVDVADGKLRRARDLGAVEAINSATEDLEARIAEISGGDGPGVVIEAVGLPETFLKAVEIVSFAGRVVYIGYAKAKVEYETKLFVSKELDIRGSRNAFDGEISAVIGMVGSAGFDVGELITHRFEFDEFDKALAFWDKNAGDVTKILVSM